jgi:hypothetical protein
MSPRPGSSGGNQSSGGGGGGKDQRPILKFQPADAFNPKPYVLRLMYDDPKEKDGTYGKQFMYTAEVVQGDSDVRDGQCVFFASPALDGLIYDLKARKGDLVAIIRTGEGTDTRWNVRLVDSQGNTIDTSDRPAKPVGQPSGGGDSGGGQRRPAKRELPFSERIAGFVLEEQRYFGAMRRAQAVLEREKQDFSVDLNAVAYVLHRMALDYDITLDGTGEPLMEEDPPEPGPELTDKQAEARGAILSKAQGLAGAPGEDELEDEVLIAVQEFMESEEVIGWHELEKQDALAFYNLVDGAKDWADMLQRAGGAPF